METLGAILGFLAITVGPYVLLAVVFAAAISLFGWLWNEATSPGPRNPDDPGPFDNPPRY